MLCVWLVMLQLAVVQLSEVEESIATFLFCALSPLPASISACLAASVATATEGPRGCVAGWMGRWVGGCRGLVLTQLLWLFQLSDSVTSSLPVCVPAVSPLWMLSPLRRSNATVSSLSIFYSHTQEEVLPSLHPGNGFPFSVSMPTSSSHGLVLKWGIMALFHCALLYQPILHPSVSLYLFLPFGFIAFLPLLSCVSPSISPLTLLFIHLPHFYLIIHPLLSLYQSWGVVSPPDEHSHSGCSDSITLRQGGGPYPPHPPSSSSSTTTTTSLPLLHHHWHTYTHPPAPVTNKPLGLTYSTSAEAAGVSVFK